MGILIHYFFSQFWQKNQKTTIMKTKKLNPLNLTLTVSLSKADESRMQLVYASQVYQTFFCVFGAFDIDRSETDALKIKGVYLQLINYKGALNLGITGVSDPQTLSIIRDTKTINTGLQINFKIKAMEESAIVKYYGFNEAKTLQNANDLFFQRVLEPLDTEKTRGITPNGIFDSEFYERDGLYTRKKTLRLDEDSTEGFWNFDKENRRWHKAPNKIEAIAKIQTKETTYHTGEAVEIETLAPRAPGGRCPKSKSIAKY